MMKKNYQYVRDVGDQCTIKEFDYHQHVVEKLTAPASMQQKVA